MSRTRSELDPIEVDRIDPVEWIASMRRLRDTLTAAAAMALASVARTS